MFDVCLFFPVYSSVDWDKKISLQFAKVQLTTLEVVQILPAVPNCTMGKARITKTARTPIAKTIWGKMQRYVTLGPAWA